MSRVGPMIRNVCGVVGVALLSAVPSRSQTMDRAIYTFIRAEQFEFAPGFEGDPLEYDLGGWIGGDYERLWFSLEGGHATESDGEREVEAQVMYGRLVSPYWDLQVGGRVDRRYAGGDGATRLHAIVGITGLAPYWFHTAAALFVSDDGHISARFETSYDLLLTQRWILEPEFELNVAVQEVPEFEVGAGITDLELGSRLRYEIVREFAPYLGFNWTRKLGSTAGLVRERGEDPGAGSVVFGVRWWW